MRRSLIIGHPQHPLLLLMIVPAAAVMVAAAEEGVVGELLALLLLSLRVPASGDCRHRYWWCVVSLRACAKLHEGTCSCVSRSLFAGGSSMCGVGQKAACEWAAGSCAIFATYSRVSVVTWMVATARCARGRGTPASWADMDTARKE